MSSYKEKLFLRFYGLQTNVTDFPNLFENLYGDSSMKKITSEEMKALQVNILIDFAKFCDKNNLHYTLGYGTLLGAIRHKGFIPWDDDIDVFMPRPDYEKFINIIRGNKISPFIDVISYKFGNSTYPFIKLIDNRTEVEEKFVKDVRIGVWIDIFAIDGNFNNSFLSMLHYKTAALIRKVVEIKRNNFGSGTTTTKRILKSFIYPFTIFFSFDFLLKTMDRVCCLRKYDKSNYIGCVVWGYGSRGRIEKKGFFECIDVEFEGHIFKVTSNYDKYLKNIYGNYMQLPPENKRIKHNYEAWWK